MAVLRSYAPPRAVSSSALVALHAAVSPAAGIVGTVSSNGIFLIPLLALLAPLASRAFGRWVRVPIIVMEMILGIIAGPSVLGWVVPGEFLGHMSDLGLATLFFMAGTEIELDGLRGRTGRRAIGGWFLSLAIGIGVGWLIAPGQPAFIIGIALCSTALGTLLPILRDAGELKTPFGRGIGALGTIGEFGPLLAISLFLSGRSPGIASIVLVIFVVVAGLAVLWALKVPRGRLHAAVSSTLHTSSQFAMRAVFLILAMLVTLSILFGIDMLLGAFTAGFVWRLLMRDADEADREAVESKLEGVSFGFLIPIFFLYTGITFDLTSLMAQPWLFALIPAGLVALLVVRGLPATLVAEKGTSMHDRFAYMLIGSTALPIIVAVTQIGVAADIISSAAAAVMVGTGMLSVLVFPIVGIALRGDRLSKDFVRGETA